MKFRKLTIADTKILKDAFERLDINNCDFTLGALYMWKDYFDYQIGFEEEMIFLRGNDVDNPSDIAYSIPLNGDVVKGIDILLNYHDTLILNVVPGLFLPRLDYQMEVSLLEEWGDYVYLFDDLKNLKGKKYNKKRNQIHQFCNAYSYTFEMINVDHLEDIKKEYLTWHDFSQLDLNKIRDRELIEALYLLDNFQPFELLGGVLKIEGRIVGWTLAEIINDTIFIHIEKALAEYQGVYQMLNYSFLNALERNDIRYVNREEDVGDEGLRKAKLSYHPLHITEKYHIKIKK